MWRALQALDMATMRRIVLGGKETSSLAPKVVYDVAHRLASASVDPAALDGLSKGFPSEHSVLPPPQQASKSTALLSDAESRAALVVLLHRLLEGGSGVRKEVPLFICETLNSSAKLQMPGSGETLLDVAHLLYQLRGDELKTKDFGIAKEELDALLASSQNSTLLGIAAISAHVASYLIDIADLVAGLSCEALQAKTTSFDDKIYRQDSSHSSVAEAAKVMRSLLQNSSLVNARKGSLDAEFIASIPEVHGAFKEACKSISGLLRVEINRVNSGCKNVSSWTTPPSPQLGYLLADSFTVLGISLRRLVLYSSERAAEGLARISGLDGQTKPAWVDDLVNNRKSLALPGSARDSLTIFRTALLLIEEATDVLALEAAVALKLLSLLECNTAGRGRKAPALGKGTSYSREILGKMLNQQLGDGGEADVLRRWFEQLQAFFSPKDEGLQDFIGSVKSLIESERRLAQVPKGTRDFGPQQMMVREASFSIITKVFKRHGASALDTPVFELKETLMGKYGEDSKLIYDLADQGGQMLSLRYDLTVPFARYLAFNGLTSMKRYQIAKVYRRDNPSAGRYREFYQCDFDIAGQYASMVPDAEVIKVLTELLDELQIGDYEIKLNHRRLLDGMLEICGVPENKFRSICSSIDKLDKTPWETVHNEMVTEKGLPPEVADRIGVHVSKRGSAWQVLRELQEQQEYEGQAPVLAELSTLFDYLEAAGCLDRVVFDLSLARGLDYYTGVIFEAVFRGSATQVGSIAAGGRYDNLVGSMFGDSKSKPKVVPAVGVSLGVERVLLIREQLASSKDLRTNETQVQVLMIGQNMMKKAFQLASELWAAGINAEFDSVSASKLTNKLNALIRSTVPYIVLAGESEENEGIVRLKKVFDKQQDDVPRGKIVAELKSLLAGSKM